jgi:membrane protein YdbS with pleckstrin-like domain
VVINKHYAGLGEKPLLFIIPLSLITMDFEHDRRPAIINLAIWVIAALWLLVLLAFLPEQRLLFIAIVGGMLTLTILVIGVSPFLTPHEVSEGRITIRQGWHSRMVVPMDQIQRIQSLERIEAKEGVLLDAFNRTLVLTDSKMNGVRLQLKKEVRVPATFWKKVDVVIFDVNDPARFVAEVEKAL